MRIPPTHTRGFLALLLASTPAAASIIGINFEGGRINPCCGGPGTAQVTGTTGFDPAPNWNNFQSNSASNLALVNDSGAIGNLFSQSLVQSLGSVFGLIAVLLAMFPLNVQLALVTVIILPVMIAATIIFSIQRGG